MFIHSKTLHTVLSNLVRWKLKVSACVSSMSDIYVLSPVNNVRFYMNYNCLPPLISAIMRKPCADIVESVKRL